MNCDRISARIVRGAIILSFLKSKPCSFLHVASPKIGTEFMSAMMKRVGMFLPLLVRLMKHFHATGIDVPLYAVSLTVVAWSFGRVRRR